jgi:hypothetical protein
MKLGFVLSLLVLWGKSLGHADIIDRDAPNDENVFVITLDGFRWQEVFKGADSALLNNPEYTRDTSYSNAMYWAETPEERRVKLMPFFWNVLARKGQVYGNRTAGSKVNAKNFYFLSYPGYNEIFTGETDPMIATNKKIRNKNTNILEYLNHIPEYEGKVAAFTSWDAFPYIFNRDRSKFFLNSGNEEVKEKDASNAQVALNKIQRSPEYAGAPTRNDMITFLSAKEFIMKNKPKVMFIGLSGTDDAAHSKKYDQYLKNANDADRIIAGLWNMVQSMPEYSGKTTFIITTDHGRGSDAANWHDHGLFIKGSSQTWIALLGNNVKPLGESRTNSQLYQKTIAGTIGYLLGVKSYSKQMLPVTIFEKDPAGERGSVAVR